VIRSGRNRFHARIATIVALAVLATWATPSAFARNFGSVPTDDVLNAAAPGACGLGRNELAAIVLAPTWPETGAGSGTPSPMTLSRYDNQSGLHAFSNPDAAYAKAFWHAGVGAWQFDSAGGRPYAAESYISTDSAARLATDEMARRWCQATTDPNLTDAQRRLYAWGPWHACTSSTICESIFQELYDASTGQLRNLTRDASVSRWGGMEPRSCRLPTVQGEFLCWYVDPARAQGAVGWRSPAFGPSPVTAPFYVYSKDGREYRHWLRADTGYEIEISASKPLSANARTSLVWSDVGQLCDRSAFRGSCDVAPPPKSTRPHSVTGTFEPVVGDFRGTGHDDILWFSPAGGDLIWRSSGDGAFTTEPISVIGQFTPVVGDYNGDGHDDIYWFSPAGGDALYYGNSSGFSATYPNANGDLTPHVGDFNGDHIDDIYWFSPTGGDAIYYGHPNGFTATYPNANGIFTPLVGDFDGDAISDIYWFSTTNGDALYYGNPNGFTAVYPNANGAFQPVLINLEPTPGDDIIWYAPGITGDAYWRSTGNRNAPFTGDSTLILGSYRPVPGQFDTTPGRDVLWYDPTGEPDPLWYR
jgi:FG-GAP-like repeat